ncbi:E3 ubiquitin-protein ligase XBAT33 [Vitis vinifera]|uniref:E3 ubiquitin-protein ligase XBAT33 n=1 Tax=Vitis vinifera TaxID=29760 RepID=A0A438CX47_VITVI|nr:E3 ubiquitin-protein ligase XBAT33 [Vitis vinifera]
MQPMGGSTPTKPRPNPLRGNGVIHEKILGVYTHTIAQLDLILSREAREREEDLERESGGLREKWGIHLGARRPANGSSRRPETGIWWKPRWLLDCNPCLAKYSTFGGLNSPLHFAAAKATMRNYCGQTALMQACRYGIGKLFRLYCSSDAIGKWHVRCIRLVVADFVPSAPHEAINVQNNGDRGDGSNLKNKYDQSALAKFVNKAADGGITALHMAALNGYFDCVQLLLDIHANVSAVTFHYGTSMDLIDDVFLFLQILLARGASRLTLNCNGYDPADGWWLPLDVARMWGRHWLEPLLAPNSDSIIPVFPPSNCLSLPLMSVLNIAR